MKINQDLCTQCEQCVPYCPMKAIKVEGDQVVIDADECVECEVCTKADVCPTDALEMEELSWPRSVRNAFSNPLLSHKDTNVPGRGTEEMKTNEVSGRFKIGRAGIAIEMGRPGTGARLDEVEKVCMACAEFDVAFEKQNPLTYLMEDKNTGKLRDDVLQEKVLSAIIEFEVAWDVVPGLMERLKEATASLNTVCSVDYAFRIDPQASMTSEAQALKYLEKANVVVSENGKTNVGLGRPLAKEE